MQNVGRMDLQQRFFCCLLRGEVGRRPTPANKLRNKFIAFSLRAFQAPKAPVLDIPSSLPRIEFASVERWSALANIAVEPRLKSGLANSTTSLAVEGLTWRSMAQQVASAGDVKERRSGFRSVKRPR